LTETAHLSAGQLAGFLDRTVATSERKAIKAHLAECDQCRHELIEVGRLARGPRQRRWIAWVPAGVAAAAAVAFLLLRSPGEPRSDTLRGTGPDGVSPIAAVAPALDAVITPDSLVFVWHAAAPDAQYRVRLTDQLGNVVWSVSQAETTAVLPRSVVLEPNRSYFWYVDALFPDGHSGTTGARHIQTAP
jgi:hypothetical protein